MPILGLSVSSLLMASGAVGGGVALAAGLVLAWPSDQKPPDVVRGGVTTFAGAGPAGVYPGALSDGPALSARFSDPSGMAADSEGNVYVADFGNNVIRKISSKGDVSVLAGSGVAGYRDGPAGEAQFSGPISVATDAKGNVYVADAVNHRIRVITAAGVVSTLAGSGPSGMGQGEFEDGPASQARFHLPKGIAVDAAGRVFVADTDNKRIRVVDQQGQVETFAGTGLTGSDDGPRLKASFGAIGQIAFDGSGNLWIADQSSQRIRRINTAGVVETIVQNGIGYAFGVVPLAGGNFVVLDTSGQVVRLFAPDGRPISVAGSGRQGYLDGAAATAEFSNPSGGVAIGGYFLVADSGNHRLRKLAW